MFIKDSSDDKEYVGIHRFFKNVNVNGTTFSFQALSQSSFYLCCGAKSV